MKLIAPQPRLSVAFSADKLWVSLLSLLVVDRAAPQLEDRATDATRITSTRLAMT
jgi:hypothetical protein